MAVKLRKLRPIKDRKIRMAKLEKRGDHELQEKLIRPKSKLDFQAEELGVYGPEFHVLSRIKRKSIVSTALSQSKGMPNR